jgi:hypothetical protein
MLGVVGVWFGSHWRFIPGLVIDHSCDYLSKEISLRFFPNYNVLMSKASCYFQNRYDVMLQELWQSTILHLSGTQRTHRYRDISSPVLSLR